ncbi:MAG: SEL1-like repeat protein [Proteobacteria bacterium]|nr:SEL1-like repeat protein [Pseudomonadota bacterium]
MGASAGNNTARLWQRGATRRAILDAARTVAARTGSIDFSLNTVAKEAGFSTTTVFAYFATKQDLILGVMADDLSKFATQMRDSYMFVPEETAHSPEDARGDAAPESELAAGPEAIILPEPVLEAAADAMASPETSVVPFASPAESRPEKPFEPPRVDAWLERRLRVFEKSLADIESRLAAVQKESATASAQVDENTKIFGARLDASEKRISELSGDLTTRMAAAEKRLRDAQTELRTSLLNASMRIDQIEAAARNVVAQTGYVPPVEIAAPVEFDPSSGDAPADKPLTAAADTYLSAARRAAQAAAALADMEQTEKKTKFPPWFNRTNMLVAGGVVVFFVLGAMVSYAIGQNVGRSTPIRVVVPRSAMQHKSRPTAAITPLDKLSALASTGNPRAELLIGLHYLKDENADKPQAAKWILKSANAHDPMGQYWAAEIYKHGDGVTADATQALRWYEAAAGQGNRQAMHDLGVAYAEGKGTPQDYGESARWFAKAAALGLTNSQFNLAVLYERGEGVKPDLAEAYKWYAIVAKTGDAESKARIEAIATQMPQSKLAAAKAAAAAFRPGMPDPDANTTTLPAS